MTNPASDSNSQPSRLEQVLADYLRALDAGEAVDQRQILALNPEFAAELKSFFANRAAIDRLAQPLREPSPDETLALPGGEGQRPIVRYFGDYELLDELGRGGMGLVFKARQTTLNRLVALKMILAGQLASPDDVQRFRQEAEAAANLDHPHIAPIYETGEHQGQHYFSMKLIEGRSLREALPQLRKNMRAGVELLAKVCRAVHHAHQRGVLHRDLKPANILLDADGTPFITDFGLAKQVENARDVTQTGAVVGTPNYMAPEQAGAVKQLTTGVDVYSLGVILYELLAGQPPFAGGSPVQTLMRVMSDEPSSPRSHNPQADQDLATIALKCLAKEPGQRYDSAAALADDLDRWLRVEPIHARPAGVLERGSKFVRRNPAWVALGSLLVTSIMLALLVSIFYSRTLAGKNTELTSTIGKLNIALEEVKTQRNVATAQTKLAGERFASLRRTSYASQVNQAANYYHNDRPNLARAEEILQSLIPAEGEEDLRGPEWFLLQRLTRADAVVAAEGKVDALRLRSDETLLVQRDLSGIDDSIDLIQGDRRKSRTMLPVVNRLRKTSYASTGDLFACIAWDGNLQLRKLTDPEAIVAEVAGDALESCVAISPSGNRLAWSAAGRPLEIWDVAEKRSLASIKTSVPSPELVQISPDDQWVLLAGGRNAALIKVADHERISSYRTLNESIVCAMAFSADSSVCAMVYSDSRVELIAMAEPLKVKSYTLVKQKIIPSSITFLGNNKQLAVGSSNALIAVFATDTAAPRIFRGHRGEVTCLAAGGSSGTFFSGSNQGEVLRWNAAVEDQRAHIFNELDDSGDPVVFTSLAYSPDGQRIVCGGRGLSLGDDVNLNGHLLLYDARTAKRIAHWQTPYRVGACQFSADGKRIFWREHLDETKVVFRQRAIDAESQRQVVAEPADLSVRAATLLPDDRLLIGDEQGEIRFAGKEEKPWPQRVRREGPAGIQYAITDLIASADNRFLLSRGNDALLRLWRIETREEIVWSVGHMNHLPMTLSADGRFAAWTVPERELYKMGLSSGQLPSSEETKFDEFAAHRRALLFNIQERKVAFVVAGHNDEIYALALSADGRRLASGDRTGMLKIWDTATGSELVSLQSHLFGMKEIAFQPQGKQFASVGAGPSLLIWPCE